MKEYYRILGVKGNATYDEIKEAYKKLSKKFHPDYNNGDKYFEERFKEIQKAYDFFTKQNRNKEHIGNASKVTTKNIGTLESKKYYINILAFISLILIVAVFLYYIFQTTNHKNHLKKEYYIPSLEMFEAEFPRYYGLDEEYSKYYEVNLDGDMTNELVLPLVYKGQNWLEGKEVKLIFFDFQNEWEVSEIYNAKYEKISKIETYPKQKSTEFHLTTSAAGINYILLNYEILTEHKSSITNKFSNDYSQNTSFNMMNGKCYGFSSIKENGISFFGCQLYKVTEYIEKNNRYSINKEMVTRNRYGRHSKDSEGCELFMVDKVLSDLIFEEKE